MVMRHKFEQPLKIKDIIQDKSRFTALDGLRGIAVLAVVINHFGYPYSTYYPSDPLAPYSFVLGELGVQLFFVISGFVILLSASTGGGAKNFVVSRFTRLYPTYWLALIFSSMLIFTVGIETRTITIPQVLVNLTMFQRFFLVDNVDQVYWTLAVEMQFYLLMLAFIFASHGRLRKDYLLNFGVAWCLLGIFLMAMYPGDSAAGVAKMIVWLVLAQHAPFFCFGMAMFIFFHDRKFNIYIPFFGIVAIINTYLAHGVNHAVGVFLILTVFSIVVIFKKTKVLDSGPFQFLGKISYSIYLFHTITGFVIIHLTQEFLGLWGSRFFAFVVVVFISWISYQLVEIRFSKYLKNKLISN